MHCQHFRHPWRSKRGVDDPTLGEFLHAGQALLAPFEQLGFVPGMVPDPGQTALPSARWLVRLLAAYGSR